MAKRIKKEKPDQGSVDAFQLKNLLSEAESLKYACNEANMANASHYKMVESCGFDRRVFKSMLMLRNMERDAARAYLAAFDAMRPVALADIEADLFDGSHENVVAEPAEPTDNVVHMDRSGKTAAFEQGIAAQAEGKSIGDNPFKPRSKDAAAWIQGYDSQGDIITEERVDGVGSNDDAVINDEPYTAA